MITEIIITIIPLVLGIAPAYLLYKEKNKGIKCGKKPSLQPPGWVFAVVWPILYILLGLSGLFLWREVKPNLYNYNMMLWFAIVIMLALWWPMFTVVLCAPRIAFASLVFIHLTILFYIYRVFGNKPAMATVIPLALWTFFASILAYQASS